MGKTLMQPDHNLMDVNFRGTRNFPIQFSVDVLQDYQHGLIDWHWHPALEFSRVQSGSVSYYVTDRKYVLQKGDGILKAANVIHRVEPNPAEPQAVLLSAFMESEFIAPAQSFLYQSCVAPLADDLRLSHLPLWQKISWQAAVLERLEQAGQLYEKGTAYYALGVHRLMCEIWELLLQNVELEQGETQSRQSLTNQVRLRQMMTYIQEHYGEKLTLARIATAVSLSQSACLDCFRQGLHTSPMEYVLQYRLDCGARLLRTSQYSIAQISEACGFGDSGYFGKLFRRQTGLSPREYRQAR